MNMRAAGLAVLAALVLASCGDDGSDGSSLLRLVHVSPDAPDVDVYIDDEIAEAGMAYLDNSGYIEVPAGVNEVTVTAAGDPGEVGIDTDVNLSEGRSYTFLIANLAADIEPILLQDDNTPPPAGAFQVRVVHGAPGAGAVDIYLTSPGVPITGATATVQDLNFGSATAYLQAAAGPMQIRITNANTLNVILDAGTVTYGSGQIRTVIVADAVGGGTPLQAEVLNDLN